MNTYDQMQRKATKSLSAWKNSPTRKPLLIIGVRQSGKTHLLKHFGETHFKRSIYLNLEQNPQLAAVFETDFNPTRILKELALVAGIPAINPQDSLLIFDEIQAQPKAVTALKYFCEDLPDLAVIGAGSLLGVSLAASQSPAPVGKFETLHLYPMTFEEFLWARNGKNWADYLPIGTEIPTHFLTQLEEAYWEYLLVGGMPEVVRTWLRTKDITAVQKLQDNLLDSYALDFSKHAPTSQQTNLKDIWRSVPQQLARDNRKFVFSQVRASARAKDLESALTWLVEAGLIHRLYQTTHPYKPLATQASATTFKVYFADCGLLCRTANFSFDDLRSTRPETADFRGALTENYVLTQLVSSGFSPYYWTSGNSAKIDFLLESATSVVPLEVKSAQNTQAKSYRSFLQKYQPDLGVKSALTTYAESEVAGVRSVTLPLGLLWHLPVLLNHGEKTL